MGFTQRWREVNGPAAQCIWHHESSIVATIYEPPIEGDAETLGWCSELVTAPDARPMPPPLPGNR